MAAIEKDIKKMYKAKYRKEFPIRKNVDPKVMEELIEGIAPEEF